MDIRAKATRAVSAAMSLNMLMWLSMLLLFAAVMFLAAAAYMAMASALTPALAALFTGVGLLVLFMALAAVIYLALRQSAGPAETPGGRRTDNAVTQAAGPDPGDPAADRYRNNTDMVVAGALAAGMVIAASPGLRRMVLRSAAPVVARKLIRAAQDFADR